MQFILLAVTLLLSVILYRMLSSYRVIYPFIRITRIERSADDKEFMVTESEEGHIAINNYSVIVEGHEYSLKNKADRIAEAFLIIENGNLISISIKGADCEKIYTIDPEHSFFDASLKKSMSGSQHHLLSI